MNEKRPPNCGGCACHISAPCWHCEEHICDCGEDTCHICGEDDEE